MAFTKNDVYEKYDYRYKPNNVYQATKLLEARYPKAPIDTLNISFETIHDHNDNPIERIRVTGYTCEHNTEYCSDWYDMKGNHDAHKCH